MNNDLIRKLDEIERKIVKIIMYSNDIRSLLEFLEEIGRKKLVEKAKNINTLEDLHIWMGEVLNELRKIREAKT